MNKQQEKQYKEYVEESNANNETPISKGDFITEMENAEKQETEDYLNYQKKIADNNKNQEALLIGTGEQGSFKPVEILTKEKWIAANKPTGETKHGRFIRLVESRTEKVLTAIDKLFSLKGANYESSLEERQQVIAALGQAVKKLESHYAGQKELTTGFKLQALPIQEKHLKDNQDLEQV